MVQKDFNRRVFALGVLVVIVGLYFIVKLSMLHFSNRISLPPEKDRHEYVRRGYIKTRGGDILAASLECRSLYANPHEIGNPEDTAVKLSRVIGLNEQYILSRLIKSGKQFVWIKRKLTENEVSLITELRIKGLYFRKEYLRVYPHGSLASHILGFVNADGMGIEGLEYRYDGLMTSYNDDMLASGEDDFRSGRSLVLTIDRVIQYTAEKELRDAVTRSNARQGSIIITEVKTGRILALAKYPSFDPNRYSDATEQERSFFTLSEPFEPGSTMKIFSAAAYLTAHPGSREKFLCTGAIDIADAEINCTGVHGRVDIQDAIKYSCNVGVISSMQSVRASAWHSLLRAFGFGERTGVEISGESPGILRDLKGWSGLSKYSTAIGQELSVTSVQLAAAYGAIANDGVYYSPYILEEVVDAQGSPVSRPERSPKGRVLPQTLARELRLMLTRVVEGGTGKNAAIPYYRVGGKTGTAQKSEKGIYVKDRNIASFAGLAPVDNPELCIVVIIDEPQGVTAGSMVAAPVFARIAYRILPYRGVTYDKPSAYPLLKSRAVKYRFNGESVPDFTGRTLPDAVKIIAAIQEKIPIHITVEGSGRVYAQSPAPGGRIKTDDTIRLRLRETQ
jgi:cell division protein FtsI (penicillin-binding protein 3)